MGLWVLIDTGPHFFLYGNGATGINKQPSLSVPLLLLTVRLAWVPLTLPPCRLPFCSGSMAGGLGFPWSLPGLQWLPSPRPQLRAAKALTEVFLQQSSLYRRIQSYFKGLSFPLKRVLYPCSACLKHLSAGFWGCLEQRRPLNASLEVFPCLVKPSACL